MAIYLSPGFWKNSIKVLKGNWLNLETYIKSFLNTKEKITVPYPFIGMGYQLPNAQLIESGDSFIFSDKNEIKKVKLKGIFEHYGSSYFYYYFGTVKVVPFNKNNTAFVFPGNLTGMVMCSDSSDFFDPTYNKIISPLAVGAVFYDIDAESFNPLDSLKVYMYEYGEANPTTGEINYAMVLEATCAVPTSDLQNALISYEIELHVPKNSTVTLWQD